MTAKPLSTRPSRIEIFIRELKTCPGDIGVYLNRDMHSSKLGSLQLSSCMANHKLQTKHASTTADPLSATLHSISPALVLQRYQPSLHTCPLRYRS